MTAQKKILVIDDEPDVVSFLSTFLSDEGFEVFTARNGPDGLEKAAREVPDLITLDITMPGMSGIEGVKHLKEKYEKPSILMITVHDDDQSLNFCGRIDFCINRDPDVFGHGASGALEIPFQFRLSVKVIGNSN